VGKGWPPLEVRREMLEEAIDLMRTLFRGGERSFRGRYFTVPDARLYTLGETAPPIYVAAGGPKAAELAARAGDGLIATNPDNELVAKYDGAGGEGKPKYIEVQLCWSRDADAARDLAHELWPTGALGGQLAQALRRRGDHGARDMRAARPEVGEERVDEPAPDPLLARRRIYAEELDPPGGLLEPELASADLAEHEPDDAAIEVGHVRGVRVAPDVVHG